MLLLLSILALIALCISKLRKHPVDKLPGPPALPFVGNLLTFAVARDGEIQNLVLKLIIYTMAKIHSLCFLSFIYFNTLQLKIKANN